jgi:hypothetical protein
MESQICWGTQIGGIQALPTEARPVGAMDEPPERLSADHQQRIHDFMQRAPSFTIGVPQPMIPGCPGSQILLGTHTDLIPGSVLEIHLERNIILGTHQGSVSVLALHRRVEPRFGIATPVVDQSSYGLPYLRIRAIQRLSGCLKTTRRPKCRRQGSGL